MSENLALILTIVLGLVGIIFSIGSLVFAIIYFFKVFKMEKEIKNLNIIKEILIMQLTWYSENEKTLSGYEVLNFLKEKYHCDDMTALKIYYSQIKDY